MPFENKETATAATNAAGVRFHRAIPEIAGLALFPLCTAIALLVFVPRFAREANPFRIHTMASAMAYLFALATGCLVGGLILYAATRKKTANPSPKPASWWPFFAAAGMATFFTVSFVSELIVIIFTTSTQQVSATIAGCLSGCVIVLLYLQHPSWWFRNIVGLFGVTFTMAALGASATPLVIILGLVVLAIYDSTAVYKTGHMTLLVEKLIRARIPLVFFIPTRRPVLPLTQKCPPADVIKAWGPSFDMMGAGDIIFPCALAISAVRFLAPIPEVLGISGNLVVGLATVTGAMAGYLISNVQRILMRKTVLAGLPPIGGGAVVGFLSALLTIYGISPILPH